jgi:protein-S-isoprenylcysteine O-methyltransferase Ste14
MGVRASRRGGLGINPQTALLRCPAWLGEIMSKALILIYGVVSYFIGVAGLACIIIVLAGLLPYGFLWSGAPVAIHPIVWNLALVVIWGAIHTGMARPGFKAVLTKFVPEPAERATYVLAAGITSIGLMGYWQNVPGQVWHFEATGIVLVLWIIFALGWAFLLAATFAINHFDLFGLRQVLLNFARRSRPPLKFVKRAMYKYVRHPIQTGVLVGIWATPSMSMTQVVLSVGFTVYIFIGLWFEERDLVREHGDAYLSYRDQVGSVIPKFGQNK